MLSICASLIASTLPAHAEEPCEGGRLIPAQYEQREIEVIYEAHRRLIVIPATYRTITEEVVVAEEHCPEEVLKTITQTVVVEEPSETIQVVPTKFERTENEAGEVRMIVDQPAYTRRATATGYPSRITRKFRNPDAANKDCAPEAVLPTIIRTVKRRVVDAPASVKSESVPETVKTITEKVLITPERCERED